MTEEDAHEADLPVVYQYQQALDRFRREGREPPLLKRMSELISLLDLTTMLGSGVPRTEMLDAALLCVMGELQVRRGALFVRREGDTFSVRAARGLPVDAPADTVVTPDDLARRRAAPGSPLEAFGFELLCPVRRGPRLVAVIGLGPREAGRRYGPEELVFLRSVGACAAAPIENRLIHHELERVNRRLSVKIFQMRNLFDISRELTTRLDEEGIFNLVLNTVMGHLLISRCAFYLIGEDRLSLAQERGMRHRDEGFRLVGQPLEELLRGLRTPVAVSALAEGPLRERLLRQRLSRIVPLSIDGRVGGLLAISERVSGGVFEDDDYDFALTLGRQALAALESARLHHVRMEKQRQDRELQIAREIQQSLFPPDCPRVPGFGLAAKSESCYQVGGDLYDWISLDEGRTALVVADVSGKGTPASILMASVHASLRALAGTLTPSELLMRLNGFLLASTQSNRFVTLFYAELDARHRSLTYVNAGHVPPYLVRGSGPTLRLDEGGPVLGLLDDVCFAPGCVHLEEGDVVAVVTDGATEALSTGDEEFGDERLITVLERCRAGEAGEILECLLGAITDWSGAAGCFDDLTALVVKAR